MHAFILCEILMHLFWYLFNQYLFDCLTYLFFHHLLKRLFMFLFVQTKNSFVNFRWMHFVHYFRPVIDPKNIRCCWCRRHSYCRHWIVCVLFSLDNSQKKFLFLTFNAFIYSTHTILCWHVFWLEILLFASHPSVLLLYYPLAIELMLYLAKALQVRIKYKNIMRYEEKRKRQRTKRESTMKIAFSRYVSMRRQAQLCVRSFSNLFYRRSSAFVSHFAETEWANAI